MADDCMSADWLSSNMIGRLFIFKIRYQGILVFATMDLACTYVAFQRQGNLGEEDFLQLSAPNQVILIPVLNKQVSINKELYQSDKRFSLMFSLNEQNLNSAKALIKLYSIISNTNNM